MGNILAIVGRPNVGKSTFFNRMVKQRQAIVEKTSGVTRDRHYGQSEWNGIHFSVIDTGGYVQGSDDIFEEEICKQVELAMDEADVILFMMDSTCGLTGMDEDVAQMIRRSKKPIHLAINKVDNPMHANEVNEFYALGFKNVFGISAMTGTGTGDLLDEVVKDFPEKETEEIADIPRIAVVGRPNVGKSSFINALLDEKRNIVTDIPGTTRDTIFSRYNRFGQDFYLVDTAGLRRKAKVHENIEFYSVMRSVRAIENSDICILMIDSQQGVESQDMNIMGLIQRNHKAVVVVVNKWDLIDKDSNTHRDYEKAVRAKMEPFTDFPIIFTSATEKQRILKTLELAKTTFEKRKNKIPASKLNNVMLPIVEDFTPPIVKGKRIKIKYFSQLPIAYPAFVVFCSNPQYIRESYKRFVENKIRENFDFKGIPMEVYFRQK